VAQKELGLRADQPFRKSSRLDQKKLVPARRRRPSGRSSRNGRGSVQCRVMPRARSARVIARVESGRTCPLVRGPPYGFTRSASVIFARPAMSETRFVCS
jgi:hypothetical protein